MKYNNIYSFHCLDTEDMLVVVCIANEAVLDCGCLQLLIDYDIVLDEYIQTQMLIVLLIEIEDELDTQLEHLKM